MGKDGVPQFLGIFQWAYPNDHERAKSKNSSQITENLGLKDPSQDEPVTFTRGGHGTRWLRSSTTVLELL